MFKTKISFTQSMPFIAHSRVRLQISAIHFKKAKPPALREKKTIRGTWFPFRKVSLVWRLNPIKRSVPSAENRKKSTLRNFATSATAAVHLGKSAPYACMLGHVRTTLMAIACSATRPAGIGWARTARKESRNRVSIQIRKTYCYEQDRQNLESTRLKDQKMLVDLPLVLARVD